METQEKTEASEKDMQESVLSGDPSSQDPVAKKTDSKCTNSVGSFGKASEDFPTKNIEGLLDKMDTSLNNQEDPSDKVVSPSNIQDDLADAKLNSSSNIQDSSSNNTQEIPCNIQDPSLNNQDSSSNTQDSSFNSQVSSSNNQDSSSNAKVSSSNSQDFSSNTQDSSSNTQDSSSNTQDSSSNTQDSSSNTQDSSYDIQESLSNNQIEVSKEMNSSIVGPGEDSKNEKELPVNLPMEMKVNSPKSNNEAVHEEPSKLIDEVCNNTTNNDTEFNESPELNEGRSRYGRTHKPKPLIDGFLSTDKKVGALLGHSPQNSPRKREDNQRLSLRGVKKLSPAKHNPGETLIAALKSLQKRKVGASSPILSKSVRPRGRPRLSNGNVLRNTSAHDSPSKLVTANKSMNNGSPYIKKLFTSDTPVKQKRSGLRKGRSESPKTGSTDICNDTKDNNNKPAEENCLDETSNLNGMDQNESKEKGVADDVEAMAEKESDSGVESSATTPPSEPEDGVVVKGEVPVEATAPSFGEWLVGDLVWGHIKGHPFWPCIIVHEPEQGIYIQTKNVGRNKMSHFHVRFFGDNARRSWIRCTQVIKFTGSTDYLKLIEEHLNRKKDFEVSPKNIPKWKSAIEEAENLLPFTRSERLKKFSIMYSDVLKEDEVQAESKEKGTFTPKLVVKKSRKRSRPVSNSPSSSENESPVKGEKIAKEITTKVSYKMKRKKLKSQAPFDTYCEKHRERIIDEFPDLNSEGIDTVLKQRWEMMEDSVKARYDVHANDGSTDGSKSSDEDEEIMEDGSEESVNVKTENEPKSVPRKRIRKSVSKDGVMPKPGGLFRGLKSDKVCIQCEEPGGEVLKCRGCIRFFHAKCSPAESKGTDGVDEFRCGDCVNNVKPPCNACWKEEDSDKKEEERKRCNQQGCGRYFHEDCLSRWPQSWWTRNTFTCPSHCCHTCASDDPRESRMHTSLAEKLVRCIRCPATYHSGDFCLPAGCVVLTGSQIICQRHYKIPKKGSYHMNTSWCFICSMGGSLICCDRCPSSFHPQCLNITAPEGSYICEDCDSARYPLYGEVVWVKLGRYRWWPAQILYPNEIPENVQSLPHALGEFAVRFFGSHDHYWVNNGRAFLYQPGDSAKTAPPKSGTDALFAKAIAEASLYYTEYAKGKADWEASNVAGRNNSSKPPRFVRIKTNKPVGDVKPFETNHASYTPCDCDPKTEKPCSQEPNCLNRMLMVECAPELCRAGDRCCNQRFQKRQYPPLTTCRTEGRGWGLQTLADISLGDFVVEYVGEMINEAECHRRIERMHRLKDENYYFLTIDRDHILDAGPKGNLSRFMNHSCNPNCETQKWTVGGETRVGLFALCDIPAGTELTFNYNLQVIGTERRPCLCGAPNCIRFIGAKSKSEQEENTVVNNTPVASNKKKATKKKKLGRRSKLLINVCSKCGHGGELIYCNVKTCGKGYHISCTELSEDPAGKWSCLLHQCVACNMKPYRQCGECSFSFCRSHIYENVNGKLSIVCSQHIKKEVSSKSKDDADVKPKEDKLSEAKKENKVIIEDDKPRTPRQKAIQRNKLALLNES